MYHVNITEYAEQDIRKAEVLAGQGFRFFTVRNYLVFYIVRKERKTVVIERFLYGRRDWAAVLHGRQGYE